MNKKRILIVSIYYPPINSVASNRIDAFAKYLNKSKYEVDILTLSPDSFYKHELENNINIYRVPNNGLFKSFKFGKKNNFIIHKTKALYNLIILSLVDEYKSWKENSIRKINELSNIKKYDFILSSYSPVVVHDVAVEIKISFPEIIWIADMRDEMSLNTFLPNHVRKTLEEKEKRIFKFCDAVTSVSKPILEDFRRLADNKSIEFCEIRNGFDFYVNEENYRNYCFTINYVGSFYGKINPNNFLKALSKIIKEKKINNLKVNFIGSTNLKIRDMKLHNYINIIEKVPHSEAIEYMLKSDCLLMIHPSTIRKGVYTGKLFEYLACLKPIIALIDEKDVASKLIKDCNAGYVASNEDLKSIEKVILIAYSNWRNEKYLNFNVNLIKKHHRKKQVQRLEIFIDSLKGSL